MEVLRNWLNGDRNYDEGVKLLLHFSADSKIKRLFTIEGPSDFKRSLLVKELQQLATGAVVVQQKEKVIETEKQAHKRWPAVMDEVVQSLFLQWKPLFSEMNNLMARIYDVAKAGNEAEAGRMAHRILDLDDQCEALYEKRDQWLQHGQLPVEHKPKKEVVDPVKMAVALKNAERYVRDFKLKLKKKPDNVRWAAKLKHWEEEVVFYKQKLKLDE